jgi:hypothetical protein
MPDSAGSYRAMALTVSGCRATSSRLSGSLNGMLERASILSRELDGYVE